MIDVVRREVDEDGSKEEREDKRREASKLSLVYYRLRRDVRSPYPIT